MHDRIPGPLKNDRTEIEDAAIRGVSSKEKILPGLKHVRDYLDGLSFRQVLWLIPVLFIIHDIEETPTIASYSQALSERLGFLNIQPFTNEQAIFAMVLLIAIVLALTYMFAGSPKNGIGMIILLSIQCLIFVNAITHILSAIYLMDYTSGLVTAIMINIPFSIYLFNRALKEGRIDGKRFACSFIIGSVMYLPSVVIGIKAGEIIASLV
ncbi:HXXEE domain-containing protein [Methanooceanicella nereidis]|nr:HXXEE domain-containing protein [Methanocella sp. CWC-04]